MVGRQSLPTFSLRKPADKPLHFKDVIDLKKTQSKAFSNLVISIVLLVFEIWAYVQTLSFKVVKNAAVQPASFPSSCVWA